VLIVGAGEAGSLVSQQMVRYPELGYYVAGFVDDDPAKLGTSMWGARVLGTGQDIPRLVAKHQIEELILAIPSAPPASFRRFVNICGDVDVQLTILPHEKGVLTGPVTLSHLREVRIEDLLAREPVELELPELAGDLSQRSVLITGAAGSIGSELARQVALHGPEVLVLLDQAETDLFYIDLELREKHPEQRIVPLVGDILDDGRLAEVMESYRPDRIYHAAAYKHVPLMEANASEAVRNNVIGTWKVAEAAGAAGAGKFVLISTDKAVNPGSVMGVTKRAAELVILSCTERHPGTEYIAVRFGNVLGSQGSVIPVFRRQLAEGRPLTVTDPEASRYFMTIPEAVQLVLEASLLGEARGQITMLDMGHPVRIIDMARNLLRLAGVTEPDSRIRITGLRPGEKLHEELTFPEEETFPSAHPKVRVVSRGDDVWKMEFLVRLKTLRSEAASDGDGEVLDWIWAECCGPAEREAVEARVLEAGLGEAAVAEVRVRGTA
jgi:FlaA1/EpsC-like NDP-sugar epimerase